MRSALETVHRLTNTTQIDVDPSVSALRLNDIDRSNHGEHNYMKTKKIFAFSFNLILRTFEHSYTTPYLPLEKNPTHGRLHCRQLSPIFPVAAYLEARKKRYATGSRIF